MPRLGHGQAIDLNQLETALAALGVHAPGLRRAQGASVRNMAQSFDYLFPGLLADPGNALPVSPQTVVGLNDLGAAMSDPGGKASDPTNPPEPGNSTIPAAYTYLGQFIDHDITLESTSAAPITDPNLTPMTRAEIQRDVLNLRTSALDLDSVYGLGPGDTSPTAVPHDGDRLVVGTVAAMPPIPPFNSGQDLPFKRPVWAQGDDFNDLPRQPPSGNIETDRAARLGDHRNDENTVISQLHVAFLRAHNRLVDEGRSLTEARRVLRRHYQYIVVHDYLKRIADPTVVDDILKRGNKVYKHNRDRFMPVEFSFGAFRFGHTMARNEYDFNLNFNLSGVQGTFPASFALLFTFTALSGQLGDFKTLPENWIIEWERLVDGAARGGMARRIDTRLADPGLFDLRKVDGSPETAGIMRHLARRNLLRGYRLGLPTGQAVAKELGITPLTEPEFQTNVTSDEFEVLRTSGFLNRTPLWYYILAEAAARGNGQRLGPVGGTIVAEVLIALVRRSEDSILKGGPKFSPTLPSAQPGTFTLPDLLRYARVLQ